MRLEAGGAPRLPPWGEKSQSPGLWDKDLVPLPRGRGRTAPRSWGLARQAGAPLGASAHPPFGGSAGSPGGRLRRGDPRLGMPAAETGWGLGSDPAWRWGRRRGAGRMAGGEGGKEFLVIPSTEELSGLMREGALGMDRGATSEGSN